jgi:hypothetical protein
MVLLRRSLRFMASLVLVIGLTACGDDDPTGVALPADAAILLTGSWAGGGGEFAMTLSLLEDTGGVVTGSGTFSSAQTGRIVEVIGTHVFPDLSLDLTVLDDGTVLTLDAVAAFQVSSNRITGITGFDGTLTGGGFDRLPIQMVRRGIGGSAGQGGF